MSSPWRTWTWEVPFANSAEVDQIGRIVSWAVALPVCPVEISREFSSRYEAKKVAATFAETLGGTVTVTETLWVSVPPRAARASVRFAEGGTTFQPVLVPNVMFTHIVWGRRPMFSPVTFTRNEASTGLIPLASTSASVGKSRTSTVGSPGTAKAAGAQSERRAEATRTPQSAAAVGTRFRPSSDGLDTAIREPAFRSRATSCGYKRIVE